ncbi:TolB-like protein [Agrobacterium tumefaciens]|nr:TolB-like protein [Agrobacterium tumefaciens]
MRSSIEIFNIRTRQMRVVWQTPDLFEAPNWSPDGKYLLLNSEGLLYRLSLTGDVAPEKVDTGFATLCNNDHGISPDGSLYAISDKVEFGKSAIYLMASAGGAPRLMTKNLPSYWHGWSPDGKSFAYCGIRDQVFDIYAMDIESGVETRLTHGEGRNDGRIIRLTVRGSISIPAAPGGCRFGAYGWMAPPSSASPTAPMATGFRTRLRRETRWCSSPMTATFSTIRAILMCGCG